MRHISVFMGVSTAVAMGGCILLEEYNYSDYVGGDSKGGAGGGSSNASSTSSSGVAGGGLMGSGGAGSGGGSTPCVPQVCNAPDPPNCVGATDDCIANSDWSGRFGMGGTAQNIFAIASRPGGGVVIGGDYDGTLDFADGGVADGGIPSRPFIAAFDTSATNLFLMEESSGAMMAESGSVLGIASSASNLYVAGVLTDVNGKRSIFVHKRNSDTGSPAQEWMNYSVEGAPSSKFLAIGFDSNRVFLAANLPTGAKHNCQNGDAFEPTGAQYGALLTLDPLSGACLRIAKLAATNVAALAFVTNDKGERLVVVTGYKQNTVVPDGGGDSTIFTSTVAKAYYTQSVMTNTAWSKEYMPTNQMGILAASAATSDETNMYLTATLKGGWSDGSANGIESVGTGENEFDTVVAAINGSNGVPIWLRRYGGPGWQQPNSIVHKNGHLFVSGLTNEQMAVDPDKSSGPLCDDLDPAKFTGCMFLVNLTTAGASQWGRAFGHDDTLVGRNAFIALGMPDLWIGGTWSGDVEFDTKVTFPAAVSPNIVLAKFSILP